MWSVAVHQTSSTSQDGPVLWFQSSFVNMEDQLNQFKSAKASKPLKAGLNCYFQQGLFVCIYFYLFIFALLKSAKNENSCLILKCILVILLWNINPCMLLFIYLIQNSQSKCHIHCEMTAIFHKFFKISSVF